MTRPISDLDVPLPTLREQIAALVERQRTQRQVRAVERLRAFLAPTEPRNDTQQEPS